MKGRRQTGRTVVPRRTQIWIYAGPGPRSFATHANRLYYDADNRRISADITQ